MADRIADVWGARTSFGRGQPPAPAGGLTSESLCAGATSVGLGAVILTTVAGWGLNTLLGTRPAKPAEPQQ